MSDNGRYSPDFVRMSLASAMVLRFESGRFYRDVRPGCVNLMLAYPEGCSASCRYCGLARDGDGRRAADTFIRVTWPIYPTESVIARLAKYRKRLDRVCISETANGRGREHLPELAREIRGQTDLPVSALIAPTVTDKLRLESIFRSGADHLGIGLDAASEKVFEKTRRPLSWERYVRTVREAREVFGPNRVNCHVIVGIGETDGELVELFADLAAIEVQAYLFCFYPEPGSAFGGRRRPSVRRFRRIQLAKHLLEQGKIRPEEISYNQHGGIAGLSADPALISDTVGTGMPFVTNGCPASGGGIGCNRPFASYRPGEPFRDYPFVPGPEDIPRVRRELGPEGLGIAL